MTCRLAISLAVLLFAAQGAAAQPPSAGAPAPQQQATQIETIYREPSNSALRPIYELLKKRQVLEELRTFLVPLRLPRKLTVQTDECGGMQRVYQRGGPVTICYELVDQIIKTAERAKPEIRSTVIAGTFIQATLHETAYGIMDILQVPIWGRASDAADRLSALVMLQFGEDLADVAVRATAIFFDLSKKTWTGSDFAAIDSPEEQRFYNYLCIAYGGSPITFYYLVATSDNTAPILPKNRARRCKGEYEQVRKAFNLRIMPFVDPDKLIAIRATPSWLSADDLK
jgi:hypothetical protein